MNKDMNELCGPLRDFALISATVCRGWEENVNEMRKHIRKLRNVIEDEDELFELEEIIDALVEIRGHFFRAHSKLDALARIIPS